MSNNSKPVSVVFSVTNCICHDQRVLKIAETVSGLNCTITIVGRKTGKCCDRKEVPFRTRRFRMIFRKGFLFYGFFNIRLFIYLLMHRYDVLVSNDLDTLLPNFIVSRLKRLPLIYDSHEYFTGVPGIQNRTFVRWVWKSIERMIFPHLKEVMTVSDSIAMQYEREYGFRPLTVRNLSRRSGHIIPYTREELGIQPDSLIVVLQGTGINPERGGEELIESVILNKKVELLIVGSGDIIGNLKRRVVQMNMESRVRFIDPLPWEELMRYTKSADIGLSLDKNSNDNHTFSLPNKLFDYLSAGIPVIASDLPEVSKLVKLHKIGIVIPSVTPFEIDKAFAEIQNDPDSLSEYKRNAGYAAGKLNWDAESDKVRELFKRVLHLNVTY